MLKFKGGSVDITPAAKCKLAGFADRKAPFTDIAEPLEANIVILQDDSTGVVFISLDLLFVGEALKRNILNRLDGVITGDNLFISATHTHFAPGTDEDKAVLGETSAEYLSFVADKVVNKIKDIEAEECESVKVYYREGRSNCGVNRRRFGWKFSTRSFPAREMLTLPDYKAFRDSKIRILDIRGADNARRALIWNFCCHPSASPSITSISSDYPGIVRARVRKSMDSEELPVVFLQGFSGDIMPAAFLKRPRKIFGAEFARYIVRRAVNGPEFSNFSQQGWSQWVDEFYGDFRSTLSRGAEIVIDGGITLTRNKIPLNAIGFTGTQREISFRSILLGNKLRIIGISAEPVAGYVGILERLFPDDIVIPVGYINSVFGYLPTEEMVSQGGYEASGFIKYFNLEGSFKPGFQEIIVHELNNLRRS
ncbi:MAG: neutral/alkaline non-lysosomal ceramidase N-terminal domain-containing protein [Candidatus Tritonobacter lacicola]|nr:neutral/alkaline non-lysosomal ceramidase N-terminal domain-containing protein [Candidatus Tritonobacter lacicola]